jgi:hypothetical protein
VAHEHRAFDAIPFAAEHQADKRDIRSEEFHQQSEDGHITISRAAGSLTFPARFMLVT